MSIPLPPFTGDDLRLVVRLLRHRLRNFAAGTAMTADLLAPGPVNPPAADMLLLARQELGALAEDVERVNLFLEPPSSEAGALGDILETARYDFAQRHPEVSLDGGLPESPAAAVAACRWLAIVLRELLDNAAQGAQRSGRLAVAFAVGWEGSAWTCRITNAAPDVLSLDERLGLALVRHYCRAAGASFRIEASTTGGVCAQLAWPEGVMDDD